MENNLWYPLEYSCLPHWLYVARWDELTRAAERKGVNKVAHWDVRLADELVRQAYLLPQAETFAELMEIDPRTGKELAESQWFIFLR